jgi:uncharacterized integral membrane protein
MSRTSVGLRGILVFLASAVAGALVGVAAASALTRSMMERALQQNPQYTGEGLQYIPAVVTFAGTALGGGLAMIYLALRARRHRANRQA